MTSDDEQIDIENAFSESWDRTEVIFAGRAKKYDEFKSLCTLIADLREKGYDIQLRAGKSMSTFILSRSRIWGLRREQPRVRISVPPDGSMKLVYRQGDYWKQTEVERVGLTTELQELLNKLLQHPID